MLATVGYDPLQVESGGDGRDDGVGGFGGFDLVEVLPSAAAARRRRQAVRPVRPVPQATLAEPDPARRRRRWILASIATVLVAGAAVAATVVLWPEPEPPTITVEPPPRFDLAAPAGWEVYAANVPSPVDGRTWFGLWAAPGGRWLLVETRPAEQPRAAHLDASRSYIGWYEAVTPGNRPGVRQVEMPLGRSRATVTTYGMRNGDVLDILDGLYPPAPGSAAPGVDAPAPFEFVASGPSLEATLYGDPMGEVVYRGPDSEVILTYGKVLAPTGTVNEVVRLLGRDPGRRYLRFETEGLVFTLEGEVDSETLNALGQRIRSVNEQAWQRLMYQRRPGLQLGPLLTIASGQTSQGAEWEAGLRLATADGELRFGYAAAPLDSAIGPPMGPRPDLTFPEVPRTTSLVVPGATYVFSLVPRVWKPIALRVEVGGVTVDAPFVDLDPALPVLVAAYAYDEPVGHTTTIVISG